MGPFKNGGRTWRPREATRGEPQDFHSLAQGKALPYGVYDTGQNRAVVHVGVTHGRVWGGKHPAMVETGRANELSGGGGEYSSGPMLGGNGNRRRAWKLNLQQMADQIQIPITVCHYPPGTGKYCSTTYSLRSPVHDSWQ